MNEEQQSIGQNVFNDLKKATQTTQWFALLIAMTYASGFLCIYTFLDRFGIREGGEEFLKAKYIHAGILFLLFPVGILIPLALKISLKAAEIKREHSSAILKEEIINLSSLAKRLSEKSDDLSSFLSDQLDQNAKVALAKYQSQNTNAQELETALVNNLNRIISEILIYDKNRFQNIDLRPETKKLCEKGTLRHWKYIRLNRLLLEDAQLLSFLDDRKKFGISINASQEGEAAKSGPFRFPIASMFYFLNISMVFYFFIFTPRNFAFTKEILIALIIITTFLIPLITDYCITTFIIPRFHVLRTILRWILVFCLIAMDWLLFRGFFRQLRIIFWGHHLIPNGGVWYVIFLTMIPYMMWRFNRHASKHETQRGKMETRLIGVSLSLMFLFLGIMSFAGRVYPYIPAAKGGGNYVESPLVKLSFRQVPGTGSIVPTNNPVWAALSVSNCFVMIERTPTALYLADIHDNGGPTEWQHMRHLPHIIEVRRDSIDQVTYTQVSDTNIYPNP